MPTRGIVYVVWNKATIAEELNKSIQSAIKFNIPYTVIEKPDAPRFQLWNKTSMYDLSPYNTTLFLDSDTEILGDLSLGFEKAEKHDLALCIDHSSYLARWYDQNLLPHKDTIEYNTGVMFFKKSEQNKKLFDLWNKLVTLKSNDQPSFSLAISQLDINPFVLPAHVWNFRVYNGDRLFGPVKIWHTRKPHILTDSIREKLTTHHGWKWYKVPEIFAQNPQDEIHVI